MTEWGGGWVGADNPLRRVELYPGDFTPRAREGGGDGDLRGEADNPQLTCCVTTCNTVHTDFTLFFCLTSAKPTFHLISASVISVLSFAIEQFDLLEQCFSKRNLTWRRLQV